MPEDVRVHDTPPFGTYIMNVRKEKGLTLKQVAEYCDVSINFLSMVERGKKFPSDQVIQKLADILNIEKHKLFLMVNRVSPNIIDTINSEEHEGLFDLISLIVKNKIKEESLQEKLIDEVYSVYEDFLKRHNLK